MKLLAAIRPCPHTTPMYEELGRLGCSVIICSDEGVDRFGDTIEFRGGAHVTAERRRTSGDPIGWESYDALRATSSRPVDWRDLRRLAREADAIIVGGYSTSLARKILQIPRERRAPTFIRAERPDHRTQGPKRLVRDALIRFAVRRSHAVFAMSQPGQRAYESFGGEVPLLAPYSLPELIAIKERQTSATSTLRVVMAGRLDARKDPLASIEVLRTLTERGEELDALFVGTGPLLDVAKAGARDLPVRFLGQMDRLSAQAEISGSDILLHPCRFDGWGMVVSEAVAFGTSVVASIHTDAAVELSRVCTTVSAVPLETEVLADAVQSTAARRRSSSGLSDIESAQRRAKELTGAREVAERVLMFLRDEL